MYRIFTKIQCKYVGFVSLFNTALQSNWRRRKIVTEKMVSISNPSVTQQRVGISGLFSESGECLQTHVDILFLGVPIWNQWRTSEPLTRPNLENADLSGLILENANLSGVNLRGAKLDNAYLYDADFQKANLQNASLNRAVLIGANFYKANLSNATLEHSYLAQSDLSNANLTNACLKSSNLRSALVSQTIFTNACIESADLTDCCKISELQLKASKDGHLAYLSDEFCHWPDASGPTDDSVPISAVAEPVDAFQSVSVPAVSTAR